VTRIVNLRKEKYDVYIGRAGKGQRGYFGNPFPLTDETKRDLVLEKYRIWFHRRLENDNEFRENILALKDKVLGCFCKPKACHGDVIVEYLNGLQA